MASKFLPEFIIERFIKLATNGRVISPKLRRVLSIIIFPIWLIGFVLCLWETIDAIIYFEIIEQPKGLLIHYEVWSFPAFILLAFILPYIILRLFYWVKDADK